MAMTGRRAVLRLCTAAIQPLRIQIHKLPICIIWAQSRYVTSSSNMGPPRIRALADDIIKPAIDGKNRGDGGRIMKKESLEEFVDLYGTSSLQSRVEILLLLANNYGSDQNLISQQCRVLMDLQIVEREISAVLHTEQKLRQLLKPAYHALFSQLGSIGNGVKFLIDLRHDALHGAKKCSLSREDGHKLVHLSDHIKDILSIWFSVGLLELRQITWETPALVLEKLAEYEAVHAVKNWMDLKHRLGPNRRCYAFFHGNMPNEPIVVLHVALTEKISDDIGAILDYKSQSSIESDVSKAKCAIFYSITSTQKGLQGIELGAYLIQTVVTSLRGELPQLTTFSSLSPIPGFRRWLLGELKEGKVVQFLDSSDQDLLVKAGRAINHGGDSMSVLKEALTHMEHFRNTEFSIVQTPLVKLCAAYLCKTKRRGYALDSVANFHMKNGAVVWRINWMADRTATGMQQSCGMMVNYRYYLNRMAKNSTNYITKQAVSVSDLVQPLLGEAPPLSSNL